MPLSRYSAHLTIALGLPSFAALSYQTRAALSLGGVPTPRAKRAAMRTWAHAFTAGVEAWERLMRRSQSSASTEPLVQNGPGTASIAIAGMWPASAVLSSQGAHLATKSAPGSFGALRKSATMRSFAASRISGAASTASAALR
ncbi:MAG: hypothetical protein IJS46_06630 [Kiritimatiellae bacterium]|nr:hypothetical protein [Kiritimatiellia bacterium]